MSFEIYQSHADCVSLSVPVRTWKFPCGETGASVIVRKDSINRVTSYKITWLWEGNDEMMALAQIVDAIRNVNDRPIHLVVPYFPYSRQDRRCNPGEGHALKMFANFINSLHFASVGTFDPHSTVLEALVDRLNITTQAVCAHWLPSHDVFIAPDAGAEKKIFTLSQVINAQSNVDVICATKKRAADGKILYSSLPTGTRLDGKTVCLVDDLCDGGATFLSLGSVARGEKPAKLNLYVTHGMFTKGYSTLFEIFDNIYVHNLSPIAPEVPECYSSRLILI